MQIVSSGGTMDALKAKPAATSTLEHYSPKELAGFLNALWDDQAHWPIPTDIRWEDFAPEKVMLRSVPWQSHSPRIIRLAWTT